GMAFTRISAAFPIVFIGCAIPLAAQTAPSPRATPAPRATLDKYCVTCHGDDLRAGDLSLQGLDPSKASEAAQTWEKVIRKLRVGVMPPLGAPHPSKVEVDALASYLETTLDRAYAANPNPGRAVMHRLNRAEYGNAVRDLLALSIDATALLPPDDES